MISCIHAPTSLADAQAILACAGGPDWQQLAITGFVVVIAVVLALVLVLLALRQVAGR